MWSDLGLRDHPRSAWGLGWEWEQETPVKRLLQ